MPNIVIWSPDSRYLAISRILSGGSMEIVVLDIFTKQQTNLIEVMSSILDMAWISN